jgi:hypothetical protein
MLLYGMEISMTRSERIKRGFQRLAIAGVVVISLLFWRIFANLITAHDAQLRSSAISDASMLLIFVVAWVIACLGISWVVRGFMTD